MNRFTRRPVVLAVPDDIRNRLFSRDSWRRLTSCTEVKVNPAGGALAAAEAKDLLAEANVLVTGWGTTTDGHHLLDLAPQLGSLVHTAGSVRTLVDDSVLARGVAVSTQADANAQPVAEYTLAMVLLAGKRTFTAQERYRTARTALEEPALPADRGVYGLRVGVIGASRIGRRVIGLLRPFDVDVLLYDPYTDDAEAERLGARRTSLDELMATCPVVTLHAPLLSATRGMITPRLLGLLPDGATLINTARGGLVDQTALVRELTTGRIDAVLDVTDPWVPDPESALWDLPNVVLTPHSAGSAGTEVRRLGDGAVDEVERLMTGQPLAHAIGRAEFAAMA